jgi:hypothetical protein
MVYYKTAYTFVYYIISDAGNLFEWTDGKEERPCKKIDANRVVHVSISKDHSIAIEARTYFIIYSHY